MSDVHTIVGQPIDRTDGALKVTGAARYAGDFSLPDLCHAAIVQSTIASGRIVHLDTTRAVHAPGVLLVMTHANAPTLPDHGRAAVNPPAGRVMSLLQDDDIHYNGQPIAVVVADTPERATYAASLVHATYARTEATLDFARARSAAYMPAKAGFSPPDSRRGDPARGLTQAEVKIEATYTTPMQTHNPMEPHATIAQWTGSKLTLHDATQYVSGVRRTVAKTLGIAEDDVHVISPFVGGGFGCKGSVWSHVVLAAMAARKVRRPVKLVLARPQMFGPVGGRPQTEQHIVLGARRDGTLTLARHDVISHTSQMEDFVEPSAIVTRMLYACPNAVTTHRLTKLNVGVPTFQRAPGEATGTFALEVALDELAYALGIDPLELRLRNYAETEPESGKPWSSKQLRECYRDAAGRFGWERRNAAPRSVHDGRELIGWGMATATYPAHRMAAKAAAMLFPDGIAVVQSGSQDIGTGTYTVMTQVAAESIGIPVGKVRFELGDTALPEAPVSGGSMTSASVGPAVRAACLALRDKLVAQAAADQRSTVHGVPADRLTIADGWITVRDDASRRDAVAAVIGRHGAPIEAHGEAKPGDEAKTYAAHSFGAVFTEVRVDLELGRIRVPRIVATYDVGQLLNAKTARSQLQGGIVWGVSFALFEHSILDPRSGRFVNANLAEYHVPVNADIGQIDVNFIDAPDLNFNPLGVRGIGEIGITGVAGALCNAVYHATGKRVRDLPITLDRLLVASQ
jgi:xanthine dehydrogenase YagR molybdenum-binding subunit